jgi:hypothetical protein
MTSHSSTPGWRSRFSQGTAISVHRPIVLLPKHRRRLGESARPAVQVGGSFGSIVAERLITVVTWSLPVAVSAYRDVSLTLQLIRFADRAEVKAGEVRGVASGGCAAFNLPGTDSRRCAESCEHAPRECTQCAHQMTKHLRHDRLPPICFGYSRGSHS